MLLSLTQPDYSSLLLPSSSTANNLSLRQKRDEDREQQCLYFSETEAGPVLALPALAPDTQLRDWSLSLFLPHSLCYNPGLRVISLVLLTLCVCDVIQVPGGLAQRSDLCVHSQHQPLSRKHSCPSCYIPCFKKY